MNQSSGWEKELPIDVVRHVPLDLVEDLQCAAAELVESVTTTANGTAYVVRYHGDLQRLDWDSLVALCPQGTARDWGVAVIGSQLAAQLEVLHDAQLSQVAVHPGRVGRFRGALVLIPTAAASLPKLSQLANAEYQRLADYLAPEVLRTRAFVAKLLFAADVYSLGRLLANLVNGSEPAGEKALLHIESRAEGREFPAEPVAAESPLATLINCMCAPAADSRPSLADVVRRCQSIADAASPQKLVEAINRQKWLAGATLAAEQISAAQAAREVIHQASRHKLIAVSDTQLKLFDVDLMLMRQPPEAGRAIPALEQLRQRHDTISDVHLRLARAYQVFEGAADHLERSLAEYRVCAELSDWNEAIVGEWCRMLAAVPDPAVRLRLTNTVPVAARPVELVKQRVQWWRENAESIGAWHEVAAIFSRIPFDAKLFDLAREVAQAAPKAGLMKWLTQHRQDPGLAAPKSLVWELLKNPGEAAKFLSEAKAYQPPEKAPPC